MDLQELLCLQNTWGYSNFLKNKKKAARNHHTVSSFNLIKELHLTNKKMYENAHTRVLAALLKYNGGEFLKSFFDRCGIRIVIPGGQGREIKVQAERQYRKNKNGKWSTERNTGTKESADLCRPDCLVWMQDSFAVIIENKINGAPETKGQIDNYLAAIKTDPEIFKKRQKPNVWVLYLGADSDSIDVPSAYSLSSGATDYIIDRKRGDRRSGPKLCLASYDEFVIPWLEEDVLPRCPFGMPGLTGGVMAYIDYLKTQYHNDRKAPDDAILKDFRNTIKAPFFLKYREAMDFISSDLVKLKAEDKEFYNALKYYYLNEYFHFENNELNNTWVIRTINSEVHLWKRSWERFQAKQHRSCDLCFVLWPYQIEDYMINGKVDRNFTCQLRYKGKDAVLTKGLIQWTTGYVFQAGSQNKLQIKQGSNLFDSFVNDRTILGLCSQIDLFLNTTKQNP